MGGSSQPTPYESARISIPHHRQLVATAVTCFVVSGVALLLVFLSPPMSRVGSSKDERGESLPAECIARIGTLRFNHQAGVDSLAFSPDKKLVATGGEDCIRLWDSETGALHRLLKVPGNPRSVFSHTSIACARQTMITASSFYRLQDGAFCANCAGYIPETELRRWDLQTGNSVLLHAVDRTEYRAIAFLNGGATVAVCGAEFPENAALPRGFVRLFDTASEAVERELEAGNQRIFDVHISADDRLMACGEKSLCVWHLSDGKARHVAIPFPGKDVTSSVDGAFIAVACGSEDFFAATASGAVLVWETETLELVHRYDLPSSVPVSLGFLADNRIVVGSRNPTVSEGLLLHWTAVPSVVTRFSEVEDLVAIEPDRRSFRSVASRHPGQPLRRHDASGRATAVCPVPNNVVRISPDGEQIATGSVFGANVRVWSTESTSLIGVVPHSGHDAEWKPTAFGFTKHRRLWTGHQVLDRTTLRTVLRVWEPTLERPQFERVIDRGLNYAGSTNSLLALVEPRESWSAQPRESDRYTLFDTATGRELRTVELPRNRIGLSRRFTRYVTSSIDESPRSARVSVYDAHTSSLIITVDVESGVPRSARFSPNDRFLVIRTEDQSEARLTVVDTAEGKTVMTLSTRRDHFPRFGFSPNSHFLCITDDTSEAVEWDLRTASPRRVLRGHQDRIVAVRYSPNGEFLATSSDDATVLLWKR